MKTTARVFLGLVILGLTTWAALALYFGPLTAAAGAIVLAASGLVAFVAAVRRQGSWIPIAVFGVLFVAFLVVWGTIRPSNDRDILVCGARRADRWRVPFVGYDAGDPRGESVEGERKRISAAPIVPCGQGAIIANCGNGVGVSTSVGFGVSGSNIKLRPLAP